MLALGLHDPTRLCLHRVPQCQIIQIGKQLLVRQLLGHPLSGLPGRVRVAPKLGLNQNDGMGAGGSRSVQKPRQARTINRRISVLASYFDYCIRCDTEDGQGAWNGHINPASGNPLAEVPRQGMVGRDLPSRKQLRDGFRWRTSHTPPRRLDPDRDSEADRHHCVLARYRHGRLLHCRSPYLLRLERVDNLGAYGIPPETGSSHPICSCGEASSFDGGTADEMSGLTGHRQWIAFEGRESGVVQFQGKVVFFPPEFRDLTGDSRTAVAGAGRKGPNRESGVAS